MSLEELIATWLASHANASLSTYCLCGLAGLCGGAIVTLIQNPTLVLPTRVGNKLKLGFVGTLLGGLLFGIFADHSVPVAMLAGIIGTPVTVFVLNEGIPAFLRSFVKELVETKKEHPDE